MTPGARPGAVREGGSGGDDLGPTLVLGGLCALAGVALVTYLGAHLAARLYAGTVLPASFAETGAVLARLPAHLRDPAAAWPPAARAVLPGAVAYYACLAATTAVAALATAAGVRAWRALDGRGANALGVRPNAGFGRPRHLRRLVVRSATPGRITLGRVGRSLVACEPQVSLAVVGPTGCGKTAGFAIPALLEWEGPVIATSVKADLLAATLEHRRRRGTVWVYDPTRCSGAPASAWSPLEACGTWAGAMRVAAWLTEAAQPRLDSVSDGDYWYAQARKGLAPYLHAAAVSGRTMRDVVRWVDSQEVAEVEEALKSGEEVQRAVAAGLASPKAERLREALRETVRAATVVAIRRTLKDKAGGAFASRPVSAWPIARQEELDERVEAEVETRVRSQVEAEVLGSLGPTGLLDPLVAARALWGKEARLRGSVFATMENVLSGYADPGVGEAAEGRGIDLPAWLAGDNTIYVVATSHEQARLRPVLTVLVQQAIRAAYDTAAANEGTLPRPCLVLLDEAGNTAPLRDLPGYASTARSHGITLVSVWQDLAQVTAIYRDRAQTVLNNHRAKLFGTGIADEATLEYVSRLVGDERRTEANLSADLHGARRTVSEHTTYRRAAPADVVRRIRPDEAVLVYGSELPAHVRLRPWFRERSLRERAERA